MWVCGLDWAGTGQGQVADACECGNEPSGSMKCGEFLDQLQTSQLLKKDSAPWSKQVSKYLSHTTPVEVFDETVEIQRKTNPQPAQIPSNNGVRSF